MRKAPLSKWKKVIATALMVTLCFGVFSPNLQAAGTQLSATSGSGNGWDGVTKEKHFSGENYEVIYTLENSWNGGFYANVKVSNTGDSAIENWYLSFESENTLSAVNAEIVRKEGGHYFLK
ncbi:MAG: cellulose binding domain-containing protein, partial [Lachnospiraceae bacterium]|nr:cellulose binding domain-containing protein [Lachnospiraceae bacterium]